MALQIVTPGAQLGLWEQRARDSRGVIPTEWEEIDDLLYRGGFLPSTLVVVGGRTHTRKTTWMLNLIHQFASQGFSVGLVGLDESPAMYTAKLASAMSKVPHEWLEQNWDDERVKDVREMYLDRFADLTMTRGPRPNFDDLTSWRATANDPAVVFVDYTSLLARDQFAGAEVQRVHRLVEDLQVWTNENETVTFTLHQVGRTDDSGTRRYHGDTPMTLEHLKYAGEEIADLVLGTYRPALDPLANMSWDEAIASLPGNWDYEKKQQKVEQARKRAEQYRASTFVQLLKNRPGTKLDFKGVEFLSVGESMAMRPKGSSLTDKFEWGEEDAN